VSVIEEFLQCPEWQFAAEVLMQALAEDSRQPPQAGIVAPPAWIPPML
jgi:hypothetical protein